MNDAVKNKQYQVAVRTDYPRDTPDPIAAGMPPRFCSKVSVDAVTGCWIWTGAMNRQGNYGRFAKDGGRAAGKTRITFAYRYSYERARGPIPEGKHMDHLCRRPPCANPWHVEPVDPADNLRRGLGTNVDGKCRRGIHEWAGDNIIVEPDGTKRCRACRDEKERARVAMRQLSTGRVGNGLKTHCPQGHPYDEANTYLKPGKGCRECRTCQRERARLWRRKETAT